MRELIKKIRQSVDMNREQFALEMGVSSLTVERWEHGKSRPGIMVQKQMYKLCVQNSIDLADFIVSQYSGEHTLYHASRSGIKGRILPCSRSRCDFGQGFYMGTDAIQPLTLVCNEDKPIFYTLNMNQDGLKCMDIEVGLEWAMLIAYFRGYMEDYTETDLYEKYAHLIDDCDVIIGYIANDRMYQVLTDFFEKRITDTALINSLSALKLGKQYVAITQKACDQITITSERALSRLELMILKDRSVVRRREGVSLAEKVVMEHRRDGRFFDEILNGGSI